MSARTPLGTSIFPIKPLGEYCEFLSGYAFKSKDFVDRGLPVVKIKNIQNGKVSTKDSQCIPKELITTKLKKFILDNSDVLIAMTGQGSVGRVGRLYCKTNENPVLNQRVGKFVADEVNLNIDYLYYILSSSAYERYLFAAGSGSGQPNLSPTIIKSVEIACAPYDIQCKIGSILKSLDDKIELNRQMKKTLEAMAQAIFKSWFVDFDPVHAKANAIANGEDPETAAMQAICGQNPDLLGDPEKLRHIASLFPSEFVESELGLIPKGWEVSILGDFGKIVTGKTPPAKINNAYSDNGIPFITPTDVDDSIFVTVTNRCLTKDGQAAVYKTRLPRHSICVTCIGSQMGKALMTTEESFTNQQINTVIVSNVNWQNYILLNLRNRRDEIFLIGSSGSTMPIINKTVFSKLRVLSPKEKIIQAFAEITSSWLSKIKQNSFENINLSKLRDTILPKLLSGELSVDNIDIGLED